MGMHETLVDNLVAQFKSMQEQITIEMIEAQPDFKVIGMLLEAFKVRGISEDEALAIIGASTINVAVIPENFQELVDAFVDTLLHVRKVLIDAGHSPQFLKAIASKFSLELS